MEKIIIPKNFMSITKTRLSFSGSLLSILGRDIYSSSENFDMVSTESDEVSLDPTGETQVSGSLIHAHTSGSASHSPVSSSHELNMNIKLKMPGISTSLFFITFVFKVIISLIISKAILTRPLNSVHLFLIQLYHL